jgi:hypothetical protein
LCAERRTRGLTARIGSASPSWIPSTRRYLLLQRDLKQLREEVAPQGDFGGKPRPLRDPAQLVEIDLGNEPSERIEDLPLVTRCHLPPFIRWELAEVGVELGVVPEDGEHALADLLPEGFPVLEPHLVSGALEGQDPQSVDLLRSPSSVSHAVSFPSAQLRSGRF